MTIVVFQGNGLDGLPKSPWWASSGRWGCMTSYRGGQLFWRASLLFFVFCCSQQCNYDKGNAVKSVESPHSLEGWHHLRHHFIRSGLRYMYIYIILFTPKKGIQSYKKKNCETVNLRKDEKFNSKINNRLIGSFQLSWEDIQNCYCVPLTVL